MALLFLVLLLLLLVLVALGFVELRRWQKSKVKAKYVNNFNAMNKAYSAVR